MTRIRRGAFLAFFWIVLLEVFVECALENLGNVALSIANAADLGGSL